MCLHVTVQPTPSVPSADVLTLDNGEMFVTLRLGGASVILPGHDAAAVAYIGAVCAALRTAALTLEARVASVRPMEHYEELNDRIAREMAREEA